MEILEIRKFPDGILREMCKAVDKVTATERKLFNNMLYTMRHFSGIGLAAPQIGLPIRLIVVEVDERIVKLANPKIIKKKGKSKMLEGCLSLPDTEIEVERPFEATVRGLNDKGENVEIDTEGLLARVLQHEIDHLNGKLIIDYMSWFKRWKYIRHRASQD